jgi:hypothetical protein
VLLLAESSAFVGSASLQAARNVNLLEKLINLSLTLEFFCWICSPINSAPIMNQVVIPHISARVDVLDKGEGTYSGQGIVGDIPHGLGSWKAHPECWFAGEWDHGIPVRGVYYDDGWVDFGEFSPDLSRKGWAAAFICDPSSGRVFGFGRPPSPPDLLLQQAMASLGINDPSVFPSSKWNSRTAVPTAQAANAKAQPAIQPPFSIEGRFDGTRCSIGNVHAGLIGGPKRMPDDVAQQVTQRICESGVSDICCCCCPIILQVWKAAIGGDPAIAKKVPYLPTFLSTHGVKSSAGSSAPSSSAGVGTTSSPAPAAIALTPEEIAAKKQERESRQAAQNAAEAEAAVIHAKTVSAITELHKQRTAKIVQLKQQNMEIGVGLSCINRLRCRAP